jgi:hypothetical protein
MRADVPSYLVITMIILSVVLPKNRRAVHATLCALYGAAFLPVGFFHAAFNRHDQGACLMRGLAKVTSLLNDAPLPEWASLPAPVQVAPAIVPAPAVATVPATLRAPVAVAPVSATVPASGIAAVPATVPVQAGVAEQPDNAPPAVRPPDLLPPAHNAARQMSEPTFDSVLTDMAERRPTGPMDIVDKPRGRHVRAEPESAEDELLTTVTTV